MIRTNHYVTEFGFDDFVQYVCLSLGGHFAQTCNTIMCIIFGLFVSRGRSYDKCWFGCPTSRYWTCTTICDLIQNGLFVFGYGYYLNIKVLQKPPDEVGEFMSTSVAVDAIFAFEVRDVDVIVEGFVYISDGPPLLVLPMFPLKIGFRSRQQQLYGEMLGSSWAIILKLKFGVTFDVVFGFRSIRY